MEQLLQIPAKLEKFSAMSHRSLRLQFDTQENLTDEQVSRITANHEKTGWLAFLVAERQLKADDVINLPEIKTEEGQKSPSERLRNTLWRVWESKGKSGSFEEFRIIWMDKLIEGLKEKYLN